MIGGGCRGSPRSSDTKIRKRHGNTISGFSRKNSKSRGLPTRSARRTPRRTRRADASDDRRRGTAGRSGGAHGRPFLRTRPARRATMAASRGRRPPARRSPDGPGNPTRATPPRAVGASRPPPALMSDDRPRNKPGRPRLDPSSSTAQFSVRVPAPTYDRIYRDASRNRCTVSDEIRRRLEAAAADDRDE